MSTGAKLIIAKLGSFGTAFLGTYALIDLAKRAVYGTIESPLSKFTFGIGLVVLGAAWLRCALTGYRGGVYSAFGAAFLYLAAFNLARIIDEALAGPVPDAWIQVAAVLIFAVGGVLLLKAGHNRHIQISGANGAI